MESYAKGETAPALLEEAVKILEVDVCSAEAELVEMLRAATLVSERISGEERFFLPDLQQAEQSIATGLKSLLDVPVTYPEIDADKASVIAR